MKGVRLALIAVAILAALVVRPSGTTAGAGVTLPITGFSVGSWFDHTSPAVSGLYSDNSTTMTRHDGGTGYSYNGHAGLDYPTSQQGYSVMAAASGIVEFVGLQDPQDRTKGFGFYVRLWHSGSSYSTLYGHMQQQGVVTQGQHVSRGQVLGYSGNTGQSTGPHLHFGVYTTQTGWTPIDPYGWSGGGSDPWSADRGYLWSTNPPSYPTVCSFDANGYEDMAAGADGEGVSGTTEAGAVEEMSGTSDGLKATSPSDDFLWSQSATGEGASESYDHFGYAVACGDFNGDGRDDLAVGAPLEDVGNDTDAGLVNVIYGSAGGLNTSDDQELRQDALGGAFEAGDQMGSALGACDFSGDAKDDLAVGAPAEDVNTVANAGAINVIYGSSPHLSGAQQWCQGYNGMADGYEAGDRLGNAFAACRW